MAIPDFIDGYHLPPGEHVCSLEEVERRFAGEPGSQRRNAWDIFCRFLGYVANLNLQPSVILIDGSFVTGRVACHDVDAVLLFPPGDLLAVLQREPPDGVNFILSVLRDPDAVRNVLGVHGFVVWDEEALQRWSMWFRCGGPNGLRDPDPTRDPVWVTKPAEKGILRVESSRGGGRND